MFVQFKVFCDFLYWNKFKFSLVVGDSQPPLTNTITRTTTRKRANEWKINAKWISSEKFRKIRKNKQQKKFFKCDEAQSAQSYVQQVNLMKVFLYSLHPLRISKIRLWSSMSQRKVSLSRSWKQIKFSSSLWFNLLDLCFLLQHWLTTILIYFQNFQVQILL